MATETLFKENPEDILRSLPDTGLLLGIDEAGRGAVLGPLVVAGVFIQKKDLPLLLEISPSDSKTFGSGLKAQETRACLSTHISQLFQTVVVKVPSCAVDRWVRGKGLNALEVACARSIITRVPCVDWVMADGARLFSPLCRELKFFHAENRADETFPLVSAASIVAKDERDRSMNAICRHYLPNFGVIGGGGYANKKTAAFLKSHFAAYKRLPSEVRFSWNWSVIQDLSLSKPPSFFQSSLFSPTRLREDIDD